MGTLSSSHCVRSTNWDLRQHLKWAVLRDWALDHEIWDSQRLMSDCEDPRAVSVGGWIAGVNPITHLDEQRWGVRLSATAQEKTLHLFHSGWTDVPSLPYQTLNYFFALCPQDPLLPKALPVHILVLPSTQLTAQAPRIITVKFFHFPAYILFWYPDMPPPKVTKIHYLHFYFPLNMLAYVD